MTSITVKNPVKSLATRGAAVATTWFIALLTWVEKLSRQRAESRQFAGRQDEAARVRTYAQQIMGHDPRFAADLFAAADRHERG